jgi:hypothetical protein
VSNPTTDYLATFEVVGTKLDEAAASARWDEAKQIEVLLDFVIQSELGNECLAFVQEEATLYAALRQATTDSERAALILKRSLARVTKVTQ